MKNATKYADELRNVYKRAVKQHPAPEFEPQEALAALVRGAMLYEVADTRADEAVKLIDREFVGLNELRVATDLEIQELLGARYPLIEKRVAMITQSLNAIFEREHTLSLDRLKTVSRRDARQFLRDLPEIHPFVEAYVMLFSFDGHAFPIDEDSLAYLKENDAVEGSATLEDAQKFVEHHLKAEECRDLFFALRKITADSSGKEKKKK
jgi:hypothetical protein